MKTKERERSHYIPFTIYRETDVPNIIDNFIGV